MTTSTKNQVSFANQTDASKADLIVFSNDIALGSDGWAQLSPFGDFPGTALISQPDGTMKRFAAVQRMDKATADGMVSNFKSLWQRAKRFLSGCPIYVGHPDVAAFGNEYKDKASKGLIVDLETRADGLYCKPIFTNEGSDLVENKKYRAFSGYWSAEAAGEENGKLIFRPDVLKSAGLTNNPNLPVHLMNERELQQETTTKPNMKEIIEWLRKQGITIANEATSVEIAAALATLEPKLTSAVTLANEKSTLTSSLTSKDATITTLTADRDLLATKFANEREARIKSLLGTAIQEGKITEADRPTWEGRLKNESTFANEAEALSKLTKTIKTESVTVELGGRKVEIANEAQRAEVIKGLVNKEMKDTGADYTDAFVSVQKANPALFAAMKKPAIAGT